MRVQVLTTRGMTRCARNSSSRPPTRCWPIAVVTIRDARRQEAAGYQAARDEERHQQVAAEDERHRLFCHGLLLVLCSSSPSLTFSACEKKNAQENRLLCKQAGENRNETEESQPNRGKPHGSPRPRGAGGLLRVLPHRLCLIGLWADRRLKAWADRSGATEAGVC